MDMDTKSILAAIGAVMLNQSIILLALAKLQPDADSAQRLMKVANGAKDMGDKFAELIND